MRASRAPAQAFAWLGHPQTAQERGTQALRALQRVPPQQLKMKMQRLGMQSLRSQLQWRRVKQPLGQRPLHPPRQLHAPRPQRQLLRPLQQQLQQRSRGHTQARLLSLEHV